MDLPAKTIQFEDPGSIAEDGSCEITLSYVPLPEDRYRYQFIVTDIIGRKYWFRLRLLRNT